MGRLNEYSQEDADIIRGHVVRMPMRVADSVLIVWQSRLTGYIGRGTQPLQRNEGKRLVCAPRIKKFPYLSHWLETIG